MKKSLFWLLILFSFQCYSQSNQFYRGIFNDPVLSALLNLPGIQTSPPYSVSNKSDAWKRSRFYYEDSPQFQHYEAINLFAYNDPVVKKLISEKAWTMLAHIALKQYSGKVKMSLDNTNVHSWRNYPVQQTSFSISKPAVYKNIAIIDLTYYYLAGKDQDKERGYRGQALFIFQRTGNTWLLKRVLNSPML